MRDDQERRANEERDRIEVVHRMEDGLVLKRVHGRQARRNREQRVPVRRSFRDGLKADEAPGAGTIVDDELLPVSLRKQLREKARLRVGDGARGRGHDDAHRPRRIGIGRPGRSSARARSGSGCDEAEPYGTAAHLFMLARVT
jgi:hypothetical protein